MNIDLILWLTGLMLFAYWLNYIMGSPLADDISKVDVRAILFVVPKKLAWRRLSANMILEPIMESALEELEVTHTQPQRRMMQDDHVRNAYETGRKFFTWERAILCPICLHWWLSVLFGAFCLTFDLFDARQDILQAGLIYLVTHLLIRKIV